MVSRPVAHKAKHTWHVAGPQAGGEVCHGYVCTPPHSWEGLGRGEQVPFFVRVWGGSVVRGQCGERALFLLCNEHRLLHVPPVNVYNSVYMSSLV